MQNSRDVPHDAPNKSAHRSSVKCRVGEGAVVVAQRLHPLRARDLKRQQDFFCPPGLRRVSSFSAAVASDAIAQQPVKGVLKHAEGKAKKEAWAPQTPCGLVHGNIVRDGEFKAEHGRDYGKDAVYCSEMSTKSARRSLVTRLLSCRRCCRPVLCFSLGRLLSWHVMLWKCRLHLLCSVRTMTSGLRVGRMVYARPQSATHAADCHNHEALCLAGRPLALEHDTKKMEPDACAEDKMHELSDGVRLFSRIGSRLWSEGIDEGSLFGNTNRLTGQWQRDQTDKSQSNIKGALAPLDSRHVQAVARASAAASVSALSACYGRSDQVLLPPLQVPTHT